MKRLKEVSNHDERGNTWKKDRLHKDHWDVTNKKGNKMKVLSFKQIEKIKQKCSFFDFDRFCGDMEMQVGFSGNVVRFGEFHTKKDKIIFKQEMERLIAVMKKVLNKKGNQKCIILKDSEKWVVEPRKMPELYSVLKKNHIHNKKTNGMIVDVDLEWQCVELLMKSVFQCNTSVIFVLPKSQVVAIPTDHMDIFIYGIAREI